MFFFIFITYWSLTSSVSHKSRKMSAGLFAKLLTRRGLAIGAATATAGGVGSQVVKEDKAIFKATDAEIQFATSYGYQVNGVQQVKPPADWTGRLFQIRNDYPSLPDLMRVKAANAENPILPGPDTPIYRDPTDDAPWLKIDFKKKPEDFCKVIKAYIWEGNVINDFVVQKNKQRQWYHAPWMHWSLNGREPLSGLTFERPTPALELSDKQTTPLQTWACGFYNEIGKIASNSVIFRVL